jgi:Amt family ammonium transporter
MKGMKLFQRLAGTIAIAFVACLVALGTPGVLAQEARDPGGYKTGNIADVYDAAGNAFAVAEPAADDPHYAQKQREYATFQRQTRSEPLAARLADSVGQNRIALNMMWVLITGFLVMFMQAGFALVETGLCRAKNASHTMLMNLLIYAIGMTGFWIAGYALMYGGAASVPSLGGLMGKGFGAEFTIHLFGKEFGLLGTRGWFLGGDAYDVGVLTMFLFQMVFMDTAATIPTGAMAERWRLAAFIVYGFFMSMLLYPLFGNWAWGGGWLATLGTNFGLGHGYVDFAGSGVVHAIGGLCGLAGAMVIGPRIGKYARDGRPIALPAHHVPMALLGTFILAFGWFGFNPGSTLAVSGGGGLRVGVIAVVTMLAGAAGSLAAAIYTWIRNGKIDPTMAANGMLAGLVAITAPSGFVGPIAGFLIGAIAGLLVCLAVVFFDRVHVDDPVGAISVHGVCGLWGVLSVGIFADGTYGTGWNGVSGAVRGILYGDAGQLAAQAIGIVTLLVWGFGLSWLFFTLQSKLMPLRVDPEVELAGLDMAETGVLAYPDFATTPLAAAGAPGSSLKESPPMHTPSTQPMPEANL